MNKEDDMGPICWSPDSDYRTITESLPLIDYFFDSAEPHLYIDPVDLTHKCWWGNKEFTPIGDDPDSAYLLH